jgi:hypothetical protein
MADDDVKTLFVDADGPPLGFDAAGIIERGGKIRRRRKRLAVLGTSLTTAAAIVAIALTSGQRTDQPAPVQPAGPGLSIETPTSSIPVPYNPRTPYATRAPGAAPSRVGNPAPPATASPLDSAKAKAKADADAAARAKAKAQLAGSSPTLAPTSP